MNAQPFVVDIDLKQNSIKNAVIENLDNAPANPKEGQQFYDTVTHMLYYFNGTEWITGRSYSAGNTNEPNENQVAIYDSTIGTKFKFRLLEKGDYIDLALGSAGAIKLKINTDSLDDYYGISRLKDKVNEIAGSGSSLVSVNLRSVEGSASTKVWYYDFGALEFIKNALGYQASYKSYDGKTYSHGFDRVECNIDDGGWNDCDDVDSSNHYFGNPVPISVVLGTDQRIALNFRVTLNDIPKELTTYLYKLRGPRFIGRVNSNDDATLVALVLALSKDSTYSWGNLKSRSSITIPNDSSKLYYVYAYPSAWGDLTSISNALGTYYTSETDTAGTSTFTRKVISVSGMNYNVYIYRNANSGTASNVNFN